MAFHPSSTSIWSRVTYIATFSCYKILLFHLKSFFIDQDEEYKDRQVVFVIIIPAEVFTCGILHAKGTQYIITDFYFLRKIQTRRRENMVI